MLSARHLGGARIVTAHHRVGGNSNDKVKTCRSRKQEGCELRRAHCKTTHIQGPLAAAPVVMLQMAAVVALTKLGHHLQRHLQREEGDGRGTELFP
jgi:hypothetical protein